MRSKINDMNIQGLDRLIREKGFPCVSIILPVQRASLKKNYEVLKKAVNMAKAMVADKIESEEMKATVVLKIDEAVTSLPPLSLDGLGIFISSAHSQIIQFPFSVKEKISVDDNFETRDLFYLKQYVTPYYVLSLSKNFVQLFHACMNELVEIKDGNFPLRYKDQFEYERSSVSSSSSYSRKGFEKEKSVIDIVRLKVALRDADIHLRRYLTSNDVRLVVAGTQKVTSAYIGVTNFSKNIIGKVPGSFHGYNMHDLGKSAWATVIEHRKRENESIIQKLIEQNNGHLALGVQEVWEAANDGKGLLLAVEKDFHCQAYQRLNQSSLLLRAPKKPYKIIGDAVDSLIEIIQKKQGKIIFTENEQLRGLNHLALLLRY